MKTSSSQKSFGLFSPLSPLNANNAEQEQPMPTTQHLRRLNASGIERFTDFLDSLTGDAPMPYPSALLTDPDATEEIHPSIEIEQRTFGSRYAAAEGCGRRAIRKCKTVNSSGAKNMDSVIPNRSLIRQETFGQTQWTS